MRSKLLFLAAILFFGAASVHAADRVQIEDGHIVVPDRALLPYWEVGLSNFDADKPQLVTLPSKSGQQLNYWVWRYRFKPTTSLDSVRKYLKEMETKASALEIQGPKTSPKDFYSRYMERIDATLRKRRLAEAYIVIHTDTGQIITDTSNPAVRNFVENRLGVEMLYTTADIRNTKLEELKVDPVSNKVEAIAIFPRIDPNVRLMEARVYGIGRRYQPTFEPGELLFLDKPYDAALRRAYRFTYRRTGSTGEDRIDNISFEGKHADWIWIWPSQIFVGRFRKVDIKRDYAFHEGSGLEEKYPSLQREYRYYPYRIYNNTYSPQDFRITSAGIDMNMKWHGHSVHFVIPDVGDAEDFWKTQVLRTVKARVDSEEELTFVTEYEKPGNLKGVEEDLAMKANVMPENGRRVRTIINPEQIATGLMIVRWGVSDIETLVDEIVNDLHISAVTDNAADGDELYDAYKGIRPEAAADTPHWKRPPEPAKEDIIKMLAKIALADLEERGISSDPKDPKYADAIRRYGEKLAPIGVAINAAAADRAEKRAESGLVDVYFETEWAGVIDRASFPSHFQRWLPKSRKLFVPEEISTGFSSGQAPAATEAVEEKAPAEEKPAQEEKKEAKKDEGFDWD